MDWEGFFTHYRKPGFIPGYEIVNKLGSGVFGEVYKARKEAIGKFYAVKFLKVSDEKVSEAVFKELDSLRYFAQIDHPNLVSIEDKGEVMGIPFIVMSYGGDETLKKRMSAGPIAPDKVREIFRQICAGVAALHEKSIIHFDLKPANIFMKGDYARVGDYGLSKLVSESHKTMSIGRGTPYYMAPEMLRRRGDHRSDIYSLGVILFEMLTGQVPFTGESEWEVLKKHETEPVVIPASVPESLRGVIERAMQKDPVARYAAVNDMIAALDRTAAGAPSGSHAIPVVPPPISTKTPPPPVPDDRRRFRRQTAGAEETLREVREQLGAVLTRIHLVGGPTAERARATLARVRRELDARGEAVDIPEARAPGAPHESFYADFDHEHEKGGANAKARVNPVAPADVPPPLPKAGANAGAAAAPSAWTWPFRAIWWLMWPIRGLFKLIGLGCKYLWIGTTIFFANFLRFAIILGLTAGLALLIRWAIVGL